MDFSHNFNLHAWQSTMYTELVCLQREHVHGLVGLSGRNATCMPRALDGLPMSGLSMWVGEFWFPGPWGGLNFNLV
jgi:hypothetical protein